MSDIDYLMLEAEREELLRRLTSGALDNLGIIERSFERRALRERIEDIDVEFSRARASFDRLADIDAVTD